MTQSFETEMTAACGELGIGIDNDRLNKLYTYYEMLVEKNKVMNLTGITDEKEVVIKHFADSLSIVKLIDIKELNKKDGALRLIDVGTGAGFPGLVLKIVFPNLHVTLFDSLNKRLIFLNEVINSLGLSGVETVHGRAEDFGRNARYREQYDIAVSRAVANMSTLSEYCVPFVKVGGVFTAYKSAETEEEMKNAETAVCILGGKTEKTVKFKLPGTDIDRRLVNIRKVKHTPQKYPRKAGVPSASPIV